MTSEQDTTLIPYIEAAQKYYLLEDLKFGHLKKRDHRLNVNIFDKFKMYCDTRDHLGVASHFGISESCCRENINRARSKVIIYKKLLERGLL